MVEGTDRVSGRQKAAAALWQENAAVVAAFIETEGNLPAVVLDAAGVVTHCNRAMLELLHLPEVPRQRPVSDFLAAETLAAIAWDSKVDYRKEAWHWKIAVGFYRAECHIYANNGGWLVFVDKPLLTDSSFVRQFDEINRELSAMGRELHKKNAAIEAAHRTLLEKETVLKQAAEMAHIGHWQWSAQQNQFQVSGNLCRLWDEGFQDRTMKEAEFLAHVITEDAIGFSEWFASLKESCRSNELEFRYRGAGGQERFGYCRADVLCDVKSRQLTIIGVIQDITERKLYAQKIERIAFYDSLTGLPNRKMFEDYFGKESARAKRQTGKIAILLMDLDGFKRVNDTLGHDAGDFVLQTVGRRMQEAVRSCDTVARIGGDEFIAYLGQLSDEQEAVVVAERILRACNQPMQYVGQETGVGVSIGISFFPTDGETLEGLMKQADLAMYFSKQRGKNSISIFHDIVN